MAGPRVAVCLWEALLVRWVGRAWPSLICKDVPALPSGWWVLALSQRLGGMGQGTLSRRGSAQERRLQLRRNAGVQISPEPHQPPSSVSPVPEAAMLRDHKDSPAGQAVP